jgi:hypothetical protein
MEEEKPFWYGLAEEAGKWAEKPTEKKEETKEEKPERLAPIPATANGLKIIKLDGISIIGVPPAEQAYLLTEKKVMGFPETEIKPIVELPKKAIEKIEYKPPEYKPVALTPEEKEKIVEAGKKVGEAVEKGVKTIGEKIKEWEEKRKAEEEKKKIEEAERKRKEAEKEAEEKAEKEKLRRVYEKLGIEVL